MDEYQPTFIIAEAGVNHNGSVETAKSLIDAASDAQADAVKFQSFKAERLVSVHAQKAEYQKLATARDESQFAMIKGLELDAEAHRELFEYCKGKNIIFLSSPFDEESIALLDGMGLEIFKVPSGEINNLPYLRKLGGLNKEVILSTGMADLGEIEDALEILTAAGTQLDKITVMHCHTEYPTPMEDVNLRAMLTIKAAFSGIKVGWSDHTLGIEVAIAAVALGASIVEKHFTLDKDMTGPDHMTSLNPDELSAMIKAVRNVEKAMGTGIKKPSPSESKNKPVVRKSIVAVRRIKEGEEFSRANITVKRPGTGISPMLWDSVIGGISPACFEPDELIYM